MKIFVDECVSRDLMPSLIGHDFTHIANTPWRGRKNGALLRLVEVDYDVFLTTDRHLPNQQNLKKFALVFVIMRGRTNDLGDVLPLVPATLAALDTIAAATPNPGDLYEIWPP